jgi:hypothetical protein
LGIIAVGIGTGAKKQLASTSLSVTLPSPAGGCLPAQQCEARIQEVDQARVVTDRGVVIIG